MVMLTLWRSRSRPLRALPPMDWDPQYAQVLAEADKAQAQLLLTWLRVKYALDEQDFLDSLPADIDQQIKDLFRAPE